MKYEYPESSVFSTECGGDMWQCSSDRISNLERVIKYSFIGTWPQEAKIAKQETVCEISPLFQI